MQRDVDLLRSSVPLYDCPPRIHLDPDFVKNSIKTVLMEQNYEERFGESAGVAASRIEAKYRKICERRAES